MAERSKTAVHGLVPRLEPEDEWNAALLAAVRPAGWTNPPPGDGYHLVVVGAGTAGLVAASIAAGLGARVALVERHLMGGDCLVSGCMPSKALLAAARARHAAGRSADGPGDFAAAMEKMRRIRAEIAPVDGAERFKALGVDVFFGHGRFVASDCLEVGGKRLRFRKAAIATGARPAVPQIAGLDEMAHLTSDTVFGLTELPPRLAVLGGGSIGCELAQAFARFGSAVHLFEAGPRLLPRDDAKAAELLARRLRAEGVELHLEAEVERIGPLGGGAVLTYGGAKGGGRLETDRLLIATGRQANVEGLGLEAAGVFYDEHGVETDDFLRTSNRRIFALGDAATQLRFTHHADAQARLMIRNAFFRGRGRAGKLVVPWCTYTSPEIAQVGLTAEEAARRGVACDLVTVEMAEVDRARLEGESEGFLEIVLAKGKDRILGATLVGEDAGEGIGLAVFAMTHGIGLRAFSGTIFPYPTRAEIFRKAGDAWNRRRLSPRYKSWLETYFRLIR